MTEETRTGLSTKKGVLLLVLGGYLTAFALAGMNAVRTVGARWGWAVVLWVGLLLFAWAMLAPWNGAAGSAGKDR